MTKSELIKENQRLLNLYNIQLDLTNEWKNKATNRLDTQMMDARIKLASQVGQLVEAVSKAVTMIVGKDVM